MDPVLFTSVAAALTALVGGLLTLFASHKAESTKLTSLESTAYLENLKIQMESWPELLEQYRQEMSRLRDRTETLETELKSTRAELKLCLERGRPPWQDA